MPKPLFYRKYIRPINNSIAYFVIRVMIFIFRLLPQKFAVNLGGASGWLFSKLPTKSKKIARKNIQIMTENGYELPDDIISSSFRESGKNIVSIFRLAKDLPKGKISVEFVGKEIFDKHYEEGKGIIVLTGHIGPFEIIPAYIGSIGYKVSVVGKELFDPRVDKIIVSNRETFGATNISSDSSARKLLKLLRDGYALGILADSNTRSVAFEYAEIFKRQERTVTGPVALARTVGLPLVPMAIYPTDYNKFQIICFDPIEIKKTNDKDQDISDALKIMNEALEKLILHDPTQWIWYHNRFRKKKPENK